MKKKTPHLKMSKQKTILLTAIIGAVGIFMLFLSILIGPSSCSPSKVEEPPVTRQDDSDAPPQPPTTTEQESTPPATEDTKPPATTEPKPAPEPDTEPAPEPDTEPAPEPEPETPIDTIKPVTPITPIEKTKTGKLIFIFDDGGNNSAQAIPFLELPFPITIAVMPGLGDSVETARLVREAGKELFLHQPMQAMNLSINPGPGAIFPDMTTADAAQIVRKNVAEIGPIAGMNNHEGSLITTDRSLMGAVLDICLDEGLLFLDSRTTAETVVPMVALERDMTFLQRDIFLDNTPDETEIRAMLQKGLAIADKQGYVIMIGHVWSPDLPGILLDLYPDLAAQGYTFTTPSKLY